MNPQFSPFMTLSPARIAVSALFLANGLIAGFWSVFVPVVQTNLGIGESAMGLLILIGASAGFVGLMLSGLLIARVGSRPMAIASGLLLAPGLLILAQATQFNFAVLFFVLLFLSLSVMDVAMNANGADVEQAQGTAMMSSFHGFWSMGAMLGAASGGFLLGHAGQNGMTGMALVTCLALVLGAAPFLAPGSFTAAAKDGKKERFSLPGNMRVYLFGVLAMTTFTAEGSVIDWSALYLREELRADVALSGFAFAGFSFAMMLARFSGDTLRQRFGAAQLLQGSAVLAVIGFAAAASGANLGFTVFGFLLAGLGCANVVPVAFSAAANVPGVSSATGITIATMFGYFGLLCAPALLGAVGEAHGFAPVFAGFALVMVMVFMIAHFARGWLSAV